MSFKQALILMVFIVMARSSAYLFSKTALYEVSPLTLLALRFLLAFALLCLIFGWKKFPKLNLRTLGHGALLGLNLAVLMFIEMLALRITDTTVVSFMISTSAVLVPLMGFMLFHNKVSTKVAIGAVVAVIGVGMLTLSNGISAIGPGHALCAVEAVLYTLLIILTGRFSEKDDPITLGILEVGVAGVLCLAAAFVFEVPTLPVSANGWACLAVLVLVCSVFGFTFQPVAQKRLSADQTGMVCTLNPVIASILGVAVLGEYMGPLHIAGAVVILAALVFTAAPKHLPTPAAWYRRHVHHAA